MDCKCAGCERWTEGFYKGEVRGGVECERRPAPGEGVRRVGEGV